jgi:hypothetical protein
VEKIVHAEGEATRRHVDHAVGRVSHPTSLGLIDLSDSNIDRYLILVSITVTVHIAWTEAWPR